MTDQMREKAFASGIDAAAEYLVQTVKRTLWNSLRKDGRARDGGFEPFPHNPRQEDYRDVVREIVRVAAPSCSGAGGGVRESLADWSDLPKDIYVIGAQRVNAVGYDVQCCSVPMVTVPEIRYVRADIAVNASVELEDARAESADSLRVLDAIAEYVGCPHDEELTVDHVRQHYMKLENAAQRQGIEDAGRIANAQAYASAEARLREAKIAELQKLGDVEAIKAVLIYPDDGPTPVPLEYILIRGFSAMGWAQPSSAAHEICEQIAALSADGDEAKKSEGGVEGHAEYRQGLPASVGDKKASSTVDVASETDDAATGNPCIAGIKPVPSDPTADVTEGERLHDRFDGNGRERKNGGFCP